jgi:Family of unknown function (DUF5681)
MANDDVGYGKPPKNTRFKAGVSGNPKGRPKRSPMAFAEVVGKVLNAPIQYRDRGQIKTASRLEVSLKLLVDRAVKGNIHDAGRILAARAHAQQFGDVGMERLIITDWLPDYPGQTAAQKTREFAATNDAGSLEWWNTEERPTEQSSEAPQSPMRGV